MADNQEQGGVVDPPANPANNAAVQADLEENEEHEEEEEDVLAGLLPEAAEAAISLSVDQMAGLLSVFKKAGKSDDGGRGKGKRLTVFNSTDPVEWSAWRVTFDKTRLLNGWDNDTARNQLAAAIEGPARRMIADIDTSTGTYTGLLNAYENRFLPEARGRISQRAFRFAKQQENEDELQFHTRLRELFCRAYPDDNINDSRILIQQYTDGLRNAIIMDYVWKNNPKSYADALEYATIQAASIANVDFSRKVNHRSVPTHHLAVMSGAAGFVENTSVDAMGSDGGISCWTCGDFGHIQRNCPQSAQPTSLVGARGGRGGRGGRFAGRGRGKPPQPRGPPAQRGGSGGGRARGGGGRGRRGGGSRRVNAVEEQTEAAPTTTIPTTPATPRPATTPRDF